MGTFQFPVEFGKALKIDERVARQLLRAIEEEPRLRLVGGNIPPVRMAETSSNPTSKAS